MKLNHIAAILFSLSGQALAFEVDVELAKKTYREVLSEKNTGVYEQGDYVYFVIKQPCLTKKKYAATDESKAAKKKFYGMLAQEFAKRNIKYDQKSIGLTGQLASDVFNEISRSTPVSGRIKHRLLFDKSNGCIREFVKAVEVNSLAQTSITIEKPVVDKATYNLLSKTIKHRDTDKLSIYLNNLGLSDFATLIQQTEDAKTFPIGIRFGDNLKAYEELDRTIIQGKPVSSPAKPIDTLYDINGVFATTFIASVPLKFKHLHTNNTLALEPFVRAQKNFEQGINGQQIVNDLVLSINFQPENIKAWRLLASMLRSYNASEAEQLVTQQLMVLSPFDLESWVYVVNALPNTSQEKNKLRQVISQLAPHFSLSSWAKKQIQR